MGDGASAEALGAVVARVGLLEEAAAAVAGEVAAAAAGLDGAVERIKATEARLEALELVRQVSEAEQRNRVKSSSKNKNQYR